MPLFVLRSTVSPCTVVSVVEYSYVQVIINGHPTVIRESIKWVDLVEQMRRHWNYSDSGYPLLIALYAKLVRSVLLSDWSVLAT